MNTTSLSEFEALCRQGTFVPVCKEVIADLATPVSAFLKIAEHSDYAFLLESVEGGEQLARYSFLGKDPFLVLTGNGESTRLERAGESRLVEEPLADVLQRAMREFRAPALPDLPRFTGGAVGFFSGWDAPLARCAGGPGASSAFMLFDTMLAFDHVRRRILLIANARLTPDERPEALYHFAIARLRFLELELERPLSRAGRTAEGGAGGEAGTTAFDVYRALRYVHPAPYMFFVRHGAQALAGSSHDMLVRVDHDHALSAPATASLPRPDVVRLVDALARDQRPGAVGYLDFAGNLDFCRATRALAIDGDGIVEPVVGAGAWATEATRGAGSGPLDVIALARTGF